MELLEKLFYILEIDEDGLSNLDSRYMSTLVQKFDGGPVSLSTMATALSEDKQTVEEFVEPYLIQLGLIKNHQRACRNRDRITILSELSAGFKAGKK